MKRFFYIIVFFLFTSCSGVEFVYKENTNLGNPIYNKTEIILSGLDLDFTNSYLPLLFGNNKKNDFMLMIDIKEKKTKRAVETNQATSNLRYDLRFYYTLKLVKENCITFKKEILSSFSVIPRSAGYNFGTDASLDKKYELAITDNLNQFISYLSNVDVNNCQ